MGISKSTIVSFVTTIWSLLVPCTGNRIMMIMTAMMMMMTVNGHNSVYVERIGLVQSTSISTPTSTTMINQSYDSINDIQFKHILTQKEIFCNTIMALQQQHRPSSVSALRTVIPTLQTLRGDTTLRNNHHNNPTSATGINTKTTTTKTNNKSRNNIIILSKSMTRKIGILFAINCGYLNGLAVSHRICHPSQSIAALTNMYTNMAISLSTSTATTTTTTPIAYRILTTPFYVIIQCIGSYILGSCMTGYINTIYVIPYHISIDRVCITLSIGIILLLLSIMAAKVSYHMTNQYFPASILYLLFTYFGLQNSLTSVYTQHMYRTTHYTGMSSDIGTYIGQLLHYYTNTNHSKKSHDLNNNNNSRINTMIRTIYETLYTNAILIVAFVMGGVLSSILYYIISNSYYFHDLKDLYDIDPFTNNYSIYLYTILMLPSILLYGSFIILLIIIQWNNSI